MNTDNNKSIIQFSNPELVESIFIENPSYKGKLDVTQKMQIDSKHSDIVNRNEFRRSADVFLTVTNFQKIDFKQERVPFFLRQTMKANFVWKKGLDGNSEENLLKVNAASLLLSYIRPEVRRITSLSKFTEQNIPFIDFTNQL